MTSICKMCHFSLSVVHFVVRLYLKYGVSPYNRTTVLLVCVVRLY
ncbi:hypothetical protein HMPREF3204_00648 [Gardnerella pickettii]|nr:hypothetical protein HMPREF3204_00648 [Gardnerella pickettii]